VVDFFKSKFSVHTSVIITFCFLIFIYDIYYGVFKIINVNMSRFRRVLYIVMTCTETIVTAASFTVLILYDCRLGVIELCLSN
jgi:hypothetical protein